MNQEDTRRTLGAALLLARSDCCDVCRALIRVRDAVAPVLSQTLAIDGLDAAVADADQAVRFAPAH